MNVLPLAFSVYRVPDLNRIPFSEAILGEFVPASVGDSFGPSWSTYWIKVHIEIPMEWMDMPVTLLVDPSCEALIWSGNGEPLLGITGGSGGDRHIDYPLTQRAKGGDIIDLFIEVACNGMFGNGDYLIGPPKADRVFELKKFEISVPNLEAHALWWDFEIISGMARDLSEDEQASADALYTANQIMNIVHMDNPESLVKGRQIANEFFEKRKYGASDHEITATGHCHIDTAWLWPYDETKRKIARSWATQCNLMDQYPNYTFTCSQAQQLEWAEKLYPDLFKRIKEKVASKQFIIVGATWVEMDCNIPSGEAFCRQFLYGQQYFKKTFGSECSLFWLPDTFGYSAQLPQIMKGANVSGFFTQKLSWNNINKFPHSTFMWTGLDGTSVLTHFSPVDTYCAQVTVKEVAFCVKNNKDKPYSNKSIMLYGNGDGGGGPQVPMIERLNRMSSLSCLPASIKPGNPITFYEELEKTSKDLVTWKGELYFELHRGTYTSQSQTKRFNRQAEFLLRNIEILAALSMYQENNNYPKSELDELWKLLLLNQFHDVLPGSSIEMVYDDAIKIYGHIIDSGTQLLYDNFFSAYKSSSAKGYSIFNATSWTRKDEVILLPVHDNTDRFEQLSDNEHYGFYTIDSIAPFSCISLDLAEMDQFKDSRPKSILSCEKLDKELVVIENKFFVVTFDKHGKMVSLFDKQVNRDVIPKGSYANVFKIYEDIPIFWDAWDVEIYHLEKGWDVSTGTLTIEATGPLVASLKVTHMISKKSSITQTIKITANSRLIDFDTTIDWHEDRKILKVEFTVNIMSDVATFETQFGHIQRPTHYNTSWDFARFEVCGHKFIDLSEYGYGVALLNDGKYGHSVHRNVMCMSILRAPKSPDQNCDIGLHYMKYAFYPHTGSFLESDVVQKGYQYNVMPIIRPGTHQCGAISFFESSVSNLIVDTIKKAEDSDDIVIRLYESLGGRGISKISSRFPFKHAFYCNIVEDVGKEIKLGSEGKSFELPFKPFELISILLRR